jgi:hypothetical protein
MKVQMGSVGERNHFYQDVFDQRVFSFMFH